MKRKAIGKIAKSTILDLTPSLAKIGDELKINEITGGYQSRSAITTLSNGDVLITWTSNHQYNKPSEIHAQRITIGGDSLHLTFNDDTNDEIIIENWSGNGRIESFQFADDTTLSDEDIDNLIGNGTNNNQSPQAQDDTLTTDEDQSLVIIPSSILGNDTDADGDNLNISSVDNAVNGSVVLDSNGNVVFTPEANFNGSTSFEYEISDNQGGSSRATVNIEVNGINDAPMVNTPLTDQTIEEGTPFNLTLPTDTFSDIDVADELNFSVSLADGSALPAWFDFDANTQTLSGIPPLDAEGVYSIKVTATDNSSLYADTSFNLTVSDNNPVITGSLGDDTLTGTDNNDVIIGEEGNDKLYGQDRQ